MGLDDNHDMSSDAGESQIICNAGIIMSEPKRQAEVLIASSLQSSFEQVICRGDEVLPGCITIMDLFVLREVRRLPRVIGPQANIVTSSSDLLQVCGTNCASFTDLQVILLSSAVVYDCDGPRSSTGQRALLIGGFCGLQG